MTPKQACRMLIVAYENGEGKIEWEDLNTAYEAACEAVGHTPKEPTDEEENP